MIPNLHWLNHHHGSVENGCISNIGFLSFRVFYPLPWLWEKRGNLVSFNFQRTTHCHDTHQAEVSPVAAPCLPLAWTTDPRTWDRSQNFWKKFRGWDFVGWFLLNFKDKLRNRGYLSISMFFLPPAIWKSKKIPMDALDSGGDCCCLILMKDKYLERHHK